MKEESKKLIYGMICTGGVFVCVLSCLAGIFEPLGAIGGAFALFFGFLYFTPERKGRWREALLLLILCLLVIIALLPPIDNRRIKYRMDCKRNLEQIGKALRQYAETHGGCFPCPNGVQGLELLRKEKMIGDAKLFVCPFCKTQAVKKENALAWINCDYVYVGAGLTLSDAPDSALLRDRPENHDIGFRNVLFLEGNVYHCRIEKQIDKGTKKENFKQ